MRRITLLALCALLFLCALPQSVFADASIASTCAVGPAGTSTGQTLSCTVSSGQVVIAGVYINSTSQAITAPSGFTQISDQPNGNGELVTFSHTAAGGDTGSYAFSWGATALYSSLFAYVLSSAGAVDAVIAGTSSTATLSVSATPTQNDLPLAFFAQGNNNHTPTTASGWTTDQIKGTGGIYLNAQHAAISSAAQTATATYDSTPASHIAGVIVLVQSVSAPALTNNLGTAHAGGPHQSIVVSVATPTPGPVYPYSPSYIYAGTATNGGGGVDCAGSPCTTGTMLGNINVRYVESGNSAGTFSGDSLCGGTCTSILYSTMNDMICDAGYETTIYNAINALSGDPAFIHTTTPVGPSTRKTVQTNTGVCSNGMYLNPSYVTGTNNLVTEWNSAYFSGKSTSDIVRWDNSSLVSNTVEYGSTAWTSLVNYTNDYAHFLGQFSSYGEGANALGNEGHFCNGAPCTGSSFQFACQDHVCSSTDSWCAANTNGNFRFLQSERVLISGAYPQSSYIQYNLPYFLNTEAQMYNNPGCSGIDVVALNPVNTGMNGDSRFFRNEQLALRIFSTPATYTGAKTDRTFVPQRYEDCTDTGQYGCVDQVAVYPEDGLQFIPKDSGMAKFTDGGANAGTGDGCGPSDTGGTTTFAVRCVGTNDQGGTGAILSRAGTCYKFGVSIGTCIELFNETNQSQTILDADCHVSGVATNCSAFPDYWKYAGTGPETCYQDLGTSLGTLSAACTSGDQICPAANGCQGAWGEAAWNGTATLGGVGTANTLGSCPGPLDNGGTGGSPTLITQECSVLLLSQ